VFKTILNKRKFIDSWFWDRYGINPYNGCRFGCIYCSSRSAKYRMPTDFENRIIVKKNIGEMLDRRLANARTLLPDVVGFSGVTDPYQPAEVKFRNTRQCLEILEKHGYPVHVCTKSGLVTRDLDILERIGRNTWCCVSVTITTIDAEISRFLERRVPPPSARFGIIKNIKENSEHIQAGILFIPIVPFLCDSDENLESMVRSAKQSKADYILFGGGMTMRDLQADWFLHHLKDRYPELIEKYEDLYRFRYKPDKYSGEYEPRKSYAVRIHKKMFALCKKYRISYRIKRYIPDDFRRENYLVAEKLLHRAYEAQMLGRAWSNTHWAGMNIQNLEESILDIKDRGELSKIRNVNDGIELLVKEILSDH
jgi:DNA repair photolyase